jgi:hypothetical protein
MLTIAYTRHHNSTKRAGGETITISIDAFHSMIPYLSSILQNKNTLMWRVTSMRIRRIVETQSGLQTRIQNTSFNLNNNALPIVNHQKKDIANTISSHLSSARSSSRPAWT